MCQLQEFTLRRRTMKLFERNGRNIIFSKNDFTANISGGEGTIYINKGYAYKVFHDSTKAIPEQKIIELKNIKNQNVITPINAIYNKDSNVIGYKMLSLDNYITLSRLFANSFLKRNNINLNKIASLASQIRQGFLDIHSQNCLVIDGNEANYMVDSNFKYVKFIDTDSFQTPSFKGSAFSPSTIAPDKIKTKDFDVGSDNYVLATILCLLYVGIHPFKGRHPDFSKRDMDGRKEQGISIFDEKTSLPKTVRSFKNIPDELLDWMIAVFKNEERNNPPEITAKRGEGNNTKIDIKKDVLKISFKKEFSFAPVNTFSYFGAEIVEGVNNVLRDNVAYRKKSEETLFLGEETYFVKNSSGKLEIRDDKQYYDVNISCDKIFSFGGDVFCKSFDKIQQLFIAKNNNKITVGFKNTKSIMPYSTDFYNNVLVEQIFDKKFFLIREKGCIYEKEIKELNSFKIINADSFKRHLIVIYSKNSNMHRMHITINESGNKYSILSDTECDTMDILISGNDNVFLSIVGDEMFVFNHDFKDIRSKSITDCNLTKIDSIFNIGKEIVVFNNSREYNISLS